MSRMIFVNLPVRSAVDARRFFTELGFAFNDEFSDDACACLALDANVLVMLLQEPYFRGLITGEIADAPAVTESIICVSMSSREEVDGTVARAIAAGGSAWKPSFADGPMYGGSFLDLDGHVWELMHLAA